MEQIGSPGATKVVSGRFRFRMGAGGGFMVALFVILVVAALVATAFEPRIVAHVKGIVYKEDYALVTEVYRGPAWLRCFSLVKNYDQWLSRRENNPLSCLDGVRVVSLLMVIHGDGASLSHEFHALRSSIEAQLRGAARMYLI